MSPPTLEGRHIVFVLSVTQFVNATPLKLLNRISWNLVGSKNTICSCPYYQETLIAWILWELCPFELRNFSKFTTEAACQRNSALKLLNRISWILVGSKDTICSCAYSQEIWSPQFCGSYVPLNIEISRNLLLKQLVSATPLKLLNIISWNLVGSKDTICSCAYYQKILIP